MNLGNETASHGPIDISIILPVDGRDEPILSRTLSAYASWLDDSGHTWEILMVPSGHMREQAEPPATRIGAIKACSPVEGWGAAIIAGLRASRGDLLCYTNWRRTSVNVLQQMLGLAVRNQEIVVRANRRTRDTRVGRLGSLLFNLECRLVLNVPAWDINGTPKIFPRAFSELLDLRETGDLIDAEFAAICEQRDYPVIEIPVDASLSPELTDARDLWSALRMYTGLIRLSKRFRRQL
jgi:hypothetical protein